MTKNAGFLIFLAILFVGIFILYRGGSQQPENYSLTQLVEQINGNNVASLTVDGNDVTIALKDGKQATTVKETETSLSQTLVNYGVNKDQLANLPMTVKQLSGPLAWLGVFLPFFLPFLLVGVFIWFMFRQAQRGNSQAMSFGLSRARILDPKDKKKQVKFSDVAGAEEAKEELREVVEFLRHPKKFLDMGAKIPKGVLLLGAPGTGKTLMAKAVAGEAGVPFFNISGSEFVEMFVGVGASRVRDLFRQAKKSAPAIVFIDEIDAVGRHRGAGLGGGNDEREQTLNQILVEMDGFETDAGVIVIASTNRPDVLDPALLRPGRFDRRVTMDLPDINEREAILRIHSKNKKMDADVNIRRLAERTPGFSGADLANLINEAAILATRRKHKTITMDELAESIEKVMLGPARRSRVISPNEKEIIAYHESGHALVAHSTPLADTVQKVSIISRGYAGGYTLATPTEDKTLHSYRYFVAEIAVLLGGYASERLVFNDVTTGPSNDLERATQMARNIVTRYGMSALGARTFGKKEELVFLGREMHEERNYSEKTAQDIDQEVSRLVKEGLLYATDILTQKRAILNALAQALLEREVLEKDEFEVVANGGKILVEKQPEVIEEKNTVTESKKK